MPLLQSGNKISQEANGNMALREALGLLAHTL